MYGDQVTCVSKYTSGHGVDGSDPDNILVRPKLFMHYVNHVTELYPYITNNAKEELAPNAIYLLQSIINWGKARVEINGDDVLGWKLDGIFRLVIEMFKNKGKNEFLISIPIKELRDELDKGTVNIYYTYNNIKEGAFRDWLNAFKTGAKNQGNVLDKFVSGLSGYTFEHIEDTEREIIIRVQKER